MSELQYWQRRHSLKKFLFEPGKLIHYEPTFDPDAPPVLRSPIPSLRLPLGLPSEVRYAAYFLNAQTYSISATPTGMSFDTNTGILSGTASTEEVLSNVIVTATNPNGSTPSNPHSITVALDPPFFTGAIENIDATEDVPITPVDVSTEFVVYQGQYTALGSWPPGITIHPTTGVISGTPTVGANYTGLQVRCSNEEGDDDSNVFTIFVRVPGLSRIIDELGNFLVDEFGNNVAGAT